MSAPFEEEERPTSGAEELGTAALRARRLGEVFGVGGH